jgi:hypothetical protein
VKGGEHDAEKLLSNKTGLYASIESDIPEELYTEDIVDYCFDRFKDMYPIHQWLLAMMERA